MLVLRLFLPVPPSHVFELILSKDVRGREREKIIIDDDDEQRN